MPDHVGQDLGNYRLIRLLGRGGFAKVYLGEHRRLGTLAALKILSARLTEADEQAFLSKARTLAQLEHPHIVRIFDFDVHEGTPFLVMSYASLETLRERHPRGTRLPVSTVIDYLSQIASALQYAHDARIIHRDIKPENVLQGRHRELLLSNFGIALLSQSSHLQSTQTIVGTVSYMAPEQLQGKPRIASDQYSLAIVVYEWLCGERPFQGSYLELYSQHLSVPPPALQEKLPGGSPALNQVRQTALAKDPTQRFASITAFVTAFEQASLPASPSRPLPAVRPSQTPPAPSLPAPAPTSPLLMPSEPASSVPPPSLQERDTLLPRHSQQPPENQEFTQSDEPYHTTSQTAAATSASPAGAAAFAKPIMAVKQTHPSLSPSPQPRTTRPLTLLLVSFLLLVVLGTTFLWQMTLHTTQATATAQARADQTAQVRSRQTAQARVAQTATVTTYYQTHGTMFGSDPQHTHYNRYEHLLSSTNVSGLKKAWTSDPTGDSISSSPAIANGVVYVGFVDHKLYAYSATGCGTGKATCPPLWSSDPTGSSIFSSPAIANGVVYVGSEDGKLYAFSLP